MLPENIIQGKITLLSTKKPQKFFEIIEIQLVVSNFGVRRFEIIFVAIIRQL